MKIFQNTDSGTNDMHQKTKSKCKQRAHYKKNVIMESFYISYLYIKIYIATESQTCALDYMYSYTSIIFI